ncbi:MAG: outer membrane lipoprotein carrier protein LolA [Crocinitomicaceae bacterium]|nr:outer membrane lipoprotein carrier protein LolA [Crocinitomicaceae bacterium]
MKKTISILAAILITVAGFAQTDQKAKDILDRASAKIEGYKTLKIKFGVVITAEGEEPISQKGVLYLKGDKYKLDMTDQEVYNDGTTVTTYLKEDNECYRTPVEDLEEEEMLSPEELLTLYEDGYKLRYDGEQEYAGEMCDVIFLYPKDPQNAKFHTVKMLVNQSKNEVVYAYLKGKEGTNMKYKLVSMEKDVEMSDDTFIFNEAEHPGVECYDE